MQRKRFFYTFIRKNKMLQNIDLSHVLFLDIETVPEAAAFAELPEEKKLLFEQKTRYQRSKEDISPEDFYERAGIWAEFGKIICISVGFFTKDIRHFRIKSFFGEEKALLEDFKHLLETHFNKPQHLLCAHNGKEFDFPYIARRMLIHRIALPGKLNLFGKKPWEVPHLDTLELWKFGDYKHYTSLQLLTTILQIPSPKDDIDGSMVAQMYYQEHDIARIVRYCEKDTLAVAQVLLRFLHKDLLQDDAVVIV